MKLRVVFKDPDGPSNCFDRAVAESLEDENITDREEYEIAFDARLEMIQKVCRRWIKHEEYITIEIDTEKGTATVLPT